MNLTQLSSTLIGLAAVLARAHAAALPETSLVPSEPPPFGRFGTSVAMSGDTAVIGAVEDDAMGITYAGAAYVFVRNGDAWSQQAKLIASDAQQSQQFGHSVAISGDTILVSALYGEATGVLGSGAAYVFVRSGNRWIEQAKLTAGDATSGDEFGGTVSLDGNTAILGAQYDEDAGVRSGSAYVFTRVGASWTQEAKLTASDAAAQHAFGHSVAINGTTAVVGAPLGPNDSAYVYARQTGGGWTEQAKLVPSDGVEIVFGVTVAISGDTIMAGATGADERRGCAYVFVKNGSSWTEQAKLMASDAAPERHFAGAVALAGERAVFGSPFDPNTGIGAAYLFKRAGNTWLEEVKLTASDAAASDTFGHSVGISGAAVIVGAPFKREADDYSGAAYIYSTAFDLIASAFVPTGNNVSVQLNDQISGTSAATISFSEVTDAGTTTVTTTDVGQLPPAGFKLGRPPVYYELSTTAIFTGPAQVCFNYAGVSYGNEANLKLLHFENGEWIDVTTSLDTVNDRICGTVTSFSPFLLAELDRTPPIVELLGALTEEVEALESAGGLNQGQANSLIAKLDAAARQIERENLSAAINQLNAFINAVQARIRAGDLSDAEGQALIEAANEIISRLTN